MFSRPNRSRLNDSIIFAGCRDWPLSVWLRTSFGRLLQEFYIFRPHDSRLLRFEENRRNWVLWNRPTCLCFQHNSQVVWEEFIWFPVCCTRYSLRGSACDPEYGDLAARAATCVSIHSTCEQTSKMSRLSPYLEGLLKPSLLGNAGRCPTSLKLTALKWAMWLCLETAKSDKFTSKSSTHLGKLAKFEKSCEASFFLPSTKFSQMTPASTREESHSSLAVGKRNLLDCLFACLAVAGTLD